MALPEESWGRVQKVDPTTRPLVFHFLPDEDVIIVDDDHLKDWEELLATRCGIVMTQEAKRQKTGSGSMGSCGSVGLDYCDDD